MRGGRYVYFIIHLKVIGGRLFLLSKTGIWRDSPDLLCIRRGNNRGGYPPSGVLEPEEWDHPVNISEFFLHGPRDWDWLRIGLWLWSFRFRGDFVLSYRRFALGVGFGRSAWRRFRVHSVGSRLVMGGDVYF